MKFLCFSQTYKHCCCDIMADRQSTVTNTLTGEMQTCLLDNRGAQGCWLILLGTDGQAGVGGLIKAGCTRMQ